MPKLYYSPASPYSAKVRMAAAHLGIALEAVVVDTNADPAELLAANPLGKIPTLVTEEGQTVFDSAVILQYLDRRSDGGLFPRDATARLAAERLEALADGIADCLLAHVYERRMRPEEKQHKPWLDRQWAKAERGLDALEGSLPQLTGTITGGDAALRALLGYLDLRFAGQWRRSRPGLVEWAAGFDARHPDLAALLPK